MSKRNSNPNPRNGSDKGEEDLLGLSTVRHHHRRVGCIRPLRGKEDPPPPRWPAGRSRAALAALHASPAEGTVIGPIDGGALTH